MMRRAAVVAASAIAMACSRDASDASAAANPSVTVSSVAVAAANGTSPDAAHVVPTAADIAAAACDNAAKADSVGRPQYATAIEFLRILHADASANPDMRQNVHFSSLGRLLTFVSDSGLTYVNVNSVGEVESPEEDKTTTTNADTLVHVRLDSLRMLLQSERGSLYDNIQSLAKVYDDSAKGYWRVRYCALADGVVILVGPDYSLAFQRQGGRLRLTRFAALEIAAD
jgi:hypothetical protein